jgi:predicted phosphodiesterase
MMAAARAPPTFIKPLRPPLLAFGGPYSNVRAVTALHAQAALLSIDAMHTICTGDVVAYCAEPEETVAAIREWGCHIVAGNCEEQLADDADDCGCGFVRDSDCDRIAKDWYAFARRRISAHSRAWMAGLPKALVLTVGGRTVRVIHGGVDRINRYVFASQRKLIAAQLEKAGADIVIAGHAGGVANDVRSLRVHGHLAVGRLGARSDADLAWETELLQHLDREGLTVPVPIPPTDGPLFADGLVVMTYVEGGPPETEVDWRRVADTLRRLHRLTQGWPQRPGWRSSTDLLHAEAGTV